jgi:pimeloyl-ACP methyl ester carboxylesterase
MPYFEVGQENAGSVELYSTFAADLNTLLEHPDLRDAVLVGHSMGAGEVTRYLGRFGSARMAKGVLVSPIPPYLPQAGDNPDGVPQSVFDGFALAARADAGLLAPLTPADPGGHHQRSHHVQPPQR